MCFLCIQTFHFITDQFRTMGYFSMSIMSWEATLLIKPLVIHITVKKNHQTNAYWISFVKYICDFHLPDVKSNTEKYSSLLALEHICTNSKNNTSPLLFISPLQRINENSWYSKWPCRVDLIFCKDIGHVLNLVFYQCKFKTYSQSSK